MRLISAIVLSVLFVSPAFAFSDRQIFKAKLQKFAVPTLPADTLAERGKVICRCDDGRVGILVYETSVNANLEQFTMFCLVPEFLADTGAISTGTPCPIFEIVK